MALKRAGAAQRRNEKSLVGAHAPGATALTPDDVRGLLLPATTQGELNELEAENILKGWRWAARSTKSRMPNMLTDTYVCELHARMFGEVWQWAGQYRQTNTNIGVDWMQIAHCLRVGLDNARFWLEENIFEPDEFAVRLHHMLVSTHPFRNGNGRHSRLMADLALVNHFRVERFSWGGGTFSRTDLRRAEYLACITAADVNDFVPLLHFCRSSR